MNFEHFDLETAASLRIGELNLRYKEIGAYHSVFIGQFAPLQHYHVSFVANKRFRSLTIDVFTNSMTVPEILSNYQLKVLEDGCVVARAIQNCFPEKNTIYVTEVLERPNRVGGIVNTGEETMLLLFSAFRGAVRTPLFQQELQNSVKLSWP